VSYAARDSTLHAAFLFEPACEKPPLYTNSALPSDSEPKDRTVRGFFFAAGLGAQNRTGSLAEMPFIVAWKGLAKYMGKGIRTVQRWEIQFGLPVRRSADRPKSQVMAVPAELDEWVKAFPLSEGLSPLYSPEIENLLQNIFELQSEVRELRRQLDQRRTEQS
jgi:hypothetical protein